MDAKKIKETFGRDFNVDKLKEGVEAMIKRVNPQFEKITAEQRKLSMPKSKKNIKFNGVQCSVSLIDDGRVIIQSPSKDTNEEAYKHLDKFDPEYLQNLETKNTELIETDFQRNDIINSLEKKVIEQCYELKFHMSNSIHFSDELTRIKSKWLYKFFNYFSK